jgi:hypothetical protein
MQTPEEHFHREMLSTADFANRHQFGIRFRQMIDQHRSVEAARRLLSTREIQTGLMRLWKLDALDKSMEALVVQQRFQGLFSDEGLSHLLPTQTEGPGGASTLCAPRLIAIYTLQNAISS